MLWIGIVFYVYPDPESTFYFAAAPDLDATPKFYTC
jgi:hypothetical protein